MSAAVQPLGAESSEVSTNRRSLQPGQAMLVGRIAEIKRTDKGLYTVIQSAASDPYAFPGIHEVQSKRPLGRPGEDCRVVVQLGGFRRSFRDSHGEQQSAVRNTLTAIED